jgi:hypothetical protein
MNRNGMKVIGDSGGSNSIPNHHAIEMPHRRDLYTLHWT